ncbi:mannose-P-dolichol utilization defect 1 protein homolog [Arctopsyche grandis]|uniref:mannose-P-dolichol utilization defect 1 protein homolog n=1 Tax=Arctopsyche grandis TaxID=121162 RepID=UPI00406D646A
MAGAIKSILFVLLSEQCYDEYFVKFNFLDESCLKSTISKGLGMSIIAGSVMVKVPQILKIFQNKSAEGINLYGVCLELFAMSATISYSFINGFPFSAWGDGIFLAIQTAIIAASVLFYNGRESGAKWFIIGYSAMMVMLMGGFTPLSVLWVLQASNIPVVFFGKMVQAYTNYKNGSTGQLSAITCGMLLFGSVARIFTSIQETGDFILILTFCIASFSNCLLAGQFMWYWNVKPVKKPKHSKKD